MSDHAPIPVLIDFHYGGLDSAASAQVRRHLNDCDVCHALSVSLRGEREALRAGVQASTREEVEETVAPRRRRRLLVVALAAAGIAAALSVAVILPAMAMKRLAVQREQHALEIRRWRDEVERLSASQDLASRHAKEQSDRSALLENQWTLLREQMAEEQARTESKLAELRAKTALDLAGLRDNLDREKAKSDAQAGESAKVRQDLEKQLAQERDKRQGDLKAQQAEVAGLARDLQAQKEAAAKAAEKAAAAPPKVKPLALRNDDSVTLTWDGPAKVNVAAPLLSRGNPVGWALQLGLMGTARPPVVADGAAPMYTGVAALGQRIFVGSGWQNKNLLAFNLAGKQLWEHVSGDNGVGTPVISEDGETVYFSTESCTIDAVTAATGRGLWTRTIGPTAMTQPALYGRTRVYVVAQGQPPAAPPLPDPKPKDAGLKPLDVFNPPTPNPRGGGSGGTNPERSMPYTLWCLNPQSGVVMWTRGLPAEAASSPVVEDGKLIVTTRDGSISAFQAETGQSLWSSTANATSAPAIVGGTLYFTTWASNAKYGFEESLSSLSIEGGMKKQVAGPYPAAYLLSLDPVQQRKDVVDGPSPKDKDKDKEKERKDVADGPGKEKDTSDLADITTAEDKVLGPLLRRTRPALPVLKHEWTYLGGRPTIADDQAFVAVGNSLLCWDLKKNAAKWDMVVGGEGEGVVSIGQGQPPLTPPAYADGKLYFGSIWGDLFCVDAAGGRMLWRYRLPKAQGIVSQVVLERGNLIATTRKGLLVAIDTRDAMATGWPMWGGSPGHNSRR